MADLLSFNSGSRKLRGKVLLIRSSCIINEWPSLLEAGPDTLALEACPERDHINKITLKLASIIARVDLRGIKVLTIDGSPHCLHLHHAVEESLKVTGTKVTTTHEVISDVKVIRVSSKAVKISRYLHKVEKLLSASELTK